MTQTQKQILAIVIGFLFGVVQDFYIWRTKYPDKPYDWTTALTRWGLWTIGGIAVAVGITIPQLPAPTVPLDNTTPLAFLLP